jgi:hypothetical protein
MPDRALLQAFLVAVVVVSVAMFLVPLSVEEMAATSNKGEASFDDLPSQLRKQSLAAIMEQQQQQQQQQSGRHNDPSPSNGTDSSISQIASIESTSRTFFLTHSSPYHVIFSSGCSTFQDWQSYVFFYHVMQSGQEGHVTRIASGCKAGQEAHDIRQIFENEIEVMAPPGRHRLHLTPDYSRVGSNGTKETPHRPFKYYNKPFGVRHWMKHALGYPENHELHDDSIVILLDPDQILMRPFTNDFTASTETWRLETGYKLKVEHGSPFSQQYGYGLQWLNHIDIEYVFDGKRTPVANLTKSDAFSYYMAMG